MYFTKSPGIGGRIRQRIEDFFVEEVPKPMPPGDEYAIFWMEKFNWDTNHAIDAVAKSLHASIKRLGLAGTKDRRALTRQRVSAWKIEPEQLKKVSIRDIRLYGFEKSSERINLGDSFGNKFRIIIRDIDLEKDGTEKRIGKIISELKDGVPNIFGSQRFGEVRKVTELVGMELLKGRLENAMKIYLTMRFEGEHEDALNARKYLEMNWGKKESYQEALKLYPKKLAFERSIIAYLSKDPNDLAGAFRKLPKHLRKMFLNAVQSRLFNEVVCRVKSLPEKVPLVGFDTKLDARNEIHKEIIRQMEAMGIGQENFKLPFMPELEITGGERNARLIPKNIELLSVDDDEFNEGKRKATIEFELPPGAYATVVLREIMKNEKA